MNKTKNNSIVFGLKILSILAFSLLIIPAKASAEDYVYCDSFSREIAINATDEISSKPNVRSLSTTSANINSGTKSVTIIGGGFMPNSVARVNGYERFTTFIDSSHLLVKLTTGDMSNSNGLFINVFNEGICGGYSNSAFFTIVSPVTSTNTGNNNNSNNTGNNTNVNNTSSTINRTNSNTNNSSYSNNTQTENITDSTTDNNSNYSNLASNTIFGSNSFMPSGLIQWILFGIIVLLLVILVRKLFGARKDYDESPMKHA
jgi:hypothetical protein